MMGYNTIFLGGEGVIRGQKGINRVKEAQKWVPDGLAGVKQQQHDICNLVVRFYIQGRAKRFMAGKRQSW